MVKAESELTHEALEAIASAFTEYPDQLALDIHAVADHIDGLGNKSIDTSVLRGRNLKVYFLTDEARPALDGILFYNKEWEGWQVRKNPYWLDTWCARFTWLEHPEIQRIAGDWASIKAEREKEAVEAARPKRESETFEQGDWKRFETDQIGQRMAMARLIERYFAHLMIRHRAAGDWDDELTAYLLLVARSAADRCTDELKYRAAIGDVDAQRALKDYTLRYFTKDECKLVEDGAVQPWDLKPANPLPFVPKVVHVKSRDWADCDEAERVYIGRNMQGHKDAGWGNPHKVGSDDSSRLEAIELYRQELLLDPVRLRKLDDLRGKRVIGCWCKSAERGYTHWAEFDKPCHGDVLVDLLKLPEAELEQIIARAEGEV